MTASDLRPIVDAAERQGAHLTLDGNEIRLRYPEERQHEMAPLIAILRENRATVISLLRHRGEVVAFTWPSESDKCMGLFGRPYTRLFPFIEKAVWTPSGKGILRQVFQDRVRVSLETDGRRMVEFSPEDILPIPG